MAGADQRAHLRVFVGRVAHAQVRGGGYQALHKGLVQGARDKQPRAGNTGLARGAENAVEHARHRVVEVGVIKDDGRRLAAQLQRHRHHLVGGDMGDVLASAGAAGERHALDQRVAGQGVAQQRALAGQHADQALGQAGLFAQTGQAQGQQRGDFRRFDHHRIARRQGWRDLLRLAGNRRIPRGDRGDHAHRLIHAHADEITA